MEPTITCEGDEPAAIRPLIRAGLGIGLLPSAARRATSQPPVAWLRVEAAGCRRTLRFVWREDTYLSAAAQRFGDFAIERMRARA